MTKQNCLGLRKFLLDNKHCMETVNIVWKADYKYLNATFLFKQSPTPQASHLEPLFQNNLQLIIYELYGLLK